MPRIRTVKPELWSSPGIAGLDLDARLLFIALWNWADDCGRGTANPRELAGFAFPHDEHITSTDIRRMLGGIRRAFGVKFYTVGGRPYFEIPSWDRHQKIDKRSQGRHPAYEDGEDWNPDPPGGSDQRQQSDSESPAESSTESAESSPSPRRNLGAGTGEQRNRGTGEKESSSRASARTRGTTTLAQLSDSAVKPAVRSIVDAWRNSQPDAAKYRPQTIREIGKTVDGLLRDGADPELVRAALGEWDRRPEVHRPGALPYVYDDVVKAARSGTQAPQSASQSGRSKRDDKALGWFALADRLADDGAEPTPPFIDTEPLAIEGMTA